LGAIVSWIPRAKQSVLSDIGARRKHALLLLAYYCVFWATLDKLTWYAKDWSRQLFDTIEGHLAGEEKFVELLKWPEQNLLYMGI
jgi:hypothetical protein